MSVALANPVLKIFIVLLLLIGVLGILHRSITESPVRSDAIESLTMGVNLAHHRVVSGRIVEEPLQATMYREPLPAFTNAIGVLILDEVLGPAEFDEYFSGKRAKYLKLQNLFWAGVLFLSAMGTLLALTGCFPLALAGAVAVNFYVPLINRPFVVDTLFTESAATSLFMLATFMLVMWARHGSRIFLLLAGLTFGLLTLTKAVFLYVVVGLFFVLPICQILARNPLDGTYGRPGRAVVSLLVFAGAFAVVVAPWMARNYAHFGTFAVSERSGLILMMRALSNQVTKDEYLGWLFVYSPMGVPEAIWARTTGFEPEDFNRGGRLQRVVHDNTDFAQADRLAEREGRPEDVISFYRQARAWRVKLANEYRALGHPRPWAAADEELGRMAVALIKSDPWRHLAFTFPALWRGGMIIYVILLAGLAYAVRCRRLDIAVTVLPALGMMTLYSVATHFESRYGTTVRPVSVVVTLAMMFLALTRSGFLIRLDSLRRKLWGLGV